MTAPEPFRIALVGIDGSGKTAVAQRLRSRGVGDHRLAVMHMTRPHEAPDAPLHGISRQLELLSATADQLASHELKLAAFYLQLCTFGPVEHFFLDTFKPEVVLADRHPLIDTLVYLPIYAVLASVRDESSPRCDLRERLGATDPGAYEAVLAWCAMQERRPGGETDLWRLGAEVLTICSLPPDELVQEFSRRFDTPLPDEVVLLDVSVEQALTHSGSRERGQELHETEAKLTMLKERYEAVLDRLPADFPAVTIHRVATDGCSIDEIADRVLERLPFEASWPAPSPA